MAMEAASEPEVTEKLSGAAPASKRRTKKSKPPPPGIVAQRVVKAKGSVKESVQELPSTAGSSGDPPAVPAEEMGAAQAEASGAPPAADAQIAAPVGPKTGTRDPRRLIADAEDAGKPDPHPPPPPHRPWRYASMPIGCIYICTVTRCP